MSDGGRTGMDLVDDDGRRTQAFQDVARDLYKRIVSPSLIHAS